MHDDFEELSERRPTDWLLVKRLAGLMTPYGALVAVSLLLLPLIAVVQVAQPYILKLVVDRAILPRSLELLTLFAGVYFASLAVEAVLRFVQTYSTQIAGQRFMFDLRQSLFRHLLAHSASFHDRNPPGRMLTRVTSDVEALNSLFSSGIVSICSDGVTVVATSVMLLWLDWRLALFCFGAVPILVPILLWFRKLMRRVFQVAKAMLSAMNAYIAEIAAGVRVVRLFAREVRNAQEFERLNRRFRDAYDRSNVYEAALFSIVEFTARLAAAGLIWSGGRSILEGELTFGTLVAAVEYTNHLFIPIRDLSSKFAVLQGAMTSAERIFAVLDAPLQVLFPPATEGRPPLRGTVEFASVEFAYRANDPVIHELSFRLAPGENVAIVGATGAGKSTLMKLLSRFYDPTGGAIRIDGIDLRELDEASLRRAVSVVLQDVFIFAGTVADNISLGNRSIPRDRIVEAARAVNAERFILRLPDGYDGHLRERGSNLSVGERQLVSFARALVLDPRILILDEATSSVDSETEVLVQQALSRVMQDRTTIVIAHRLSTIRHADRILVLHKGRLVEEGSHEELLKRRGVYRRLYELQYRDQEPDVSAGPEQPRVEQALGGRP